MKAETNRSPEFEDETERTKKYMHMNKIRFILAVVLVMMLVCACGCADISKTGLEAGVALTDSEAETAEMPEIGKPYPNTDGVYRVIVTDSDGNPVEEVIVRFCSDTACRFGITDENGITEFQADEGILYTVHLDDVPEGYEELSEEFETLECYCDIFLVLQKKTDPET